MAYDDDGTALGWCSIAPLSTYGRFNSVAASSNLWVLACVAVSPGARGRGVPAKLIEAAIALAIDGGAGAILGLPIGWRADSDEGLERLLATMRSAGFVEEPELPEAFHLRYSPA